MIPDDLHIPGDLILYGVAGSHAYGTNVEGSDNDYKGIYICNESFRNGLRTAPESLKRNVPDLTIYELRKFMKLALKCNPNILELLFQDESYILSESYLGRILRCGKDIFLSKRAFAAYAGFAQSQRKRLQGYRNNSEKRRELREKYGYDTKFGMHLIRLLRMLNEILESGKVVVHRPDAQELIAIRNGSLALDELLEMALDLEENAKSLLDKSDLPEEPLFEEADLLCRELYSIYDNSER